MHFLASPTGGVSTAIASCLVSMRGRRESNATTPPHSAPHSYRFTTRKAQSLLFSEIVVTTAHQEAPPLLSNPAPLMNYAGPAHCALLDKGRSALGVEKGTKGVPGGWVANEPGFLRAGGGTPSICKRRRYDGVLGRTRGRGHAVPGSTTPSAARGGLGIGGGPACRGA